MTLARNAARGAAISVTAQWAKFAIQIATLAVLARILSPQDFGIVAMVTAIVGVATLLSDFGLSMAAMQAKELTDQQRTNLFWLNVALGATMTVLVYLAATLIADVYGQEQVVGVVHLLAPLFLIQSGITQFRAEAARRLSYGRLAVVDIVAQLIGLGLAVTLAVNGARYQALVAQQLGIAATAFLLYALTSPWRPGLPGRFVQMKPLLSFGAGAGGVQFLNYISSNADNVMLGRYRGSAVLGVYNQAYQLFKVPLQQLAAPMTQVAVPVLSRIDDPKEFERYAFRAQVVLTYLLGGAFLVTASLSRPIFALILGPGWGQAPTIFTILTIGGMFQVLGYVFYWIFLAKGLTGRQLKYSTISRLLMVGFMAIGLRWGAYGVAAGASLGLFINWLMLGIFVLPHTGIKLVAIARQALRPLTACAIEFAIVFPLSLKVDAHFSPLVSLCMLSVVAAAVLGVVVAASPAIRADLRLIIVTAKLVRSRRPTLAVASNPAAGVAAPLPVAVSEAAS
jgi:O-antigen/teichoic acid export membrane protein